MTKCLGDTGNNGRFIIHMARGASQYLAFRELGWDGRDDWIVELFCTRKGVATVLFSAFVSILLGLTTSTSPGIGIYGSLSVLFFLSFSFSDITSERVGGCFGTGYTWVWLGFSARGHFQDMEGEGRLGSLERTVCLAGWALLAWDLCFSGDLIILIFLLLRSIDAFHGATPYHSLSLHVLFGFGRCCLISVPTM
jgi:hypothetical protein